jgi:hypothetical protein
MSYNYNPYGQPLYQYPQTTQVIIEELRPGYVVQAPPTVIVTQPTPVYASTGLVGGGIGGFGLGLIGGSLLGGGYGGYGYGYGHHGWGH